MDEELDPGGTFRLEYSLKAVDNGEEGPYPYEVYEGPVFGGESGACHRGENGGGWWRERAVVTEGEREKGS